MNKKIKEQIENFYEANLIEQILKELKKIRVWGVKEYGEYGRALNNLERYEEALKYFFDPKGKDEKDPLWNYRVAYSYFFLEKWEEAIFYAKRALPLEGENQQQVRYFIMESYVELEDIEGLEKFLQEYPFPEDPDWNFYSFSVFAHKGEGKKGIPNLKKLITFLNKKREKEDAKKFAKILTQLYFDEGMSKEYEAMKKKYHFTDSLFDITSYSEEEEKKIIKHIKKYFGKADIRLDNFNTEYADIDLLIIPATTKHPYTTLMTLGMGSRFMPGTPEELVEEKFGYDELFLCLPDDWDFSKENAWPIQYLLDLAKFPFDNKSWLAAGHSISYDTYLGETNFSGFLLTYPYEHGMESFQVELDENKTVHFYNIVPLYLEELNYKQEKSFEELEALFQDSPMVINAHRKNVALEVEESPSDEENNILYQ